MARDAGEPRQCSARHGQKLYLQCVEMVTEMTVHSGNHWAIDRDGKTVRWSDMVAMYPAIDGNFRANDPTMGAEVIREKLAEKGIGNGSARLGQVGGEHYRKFKIQPWDVIDEYGLSFYAGNTLKYLLRAGHKGAALEDLKKARHYLDKLIELESGDGSS